MDGQRPGICVQLDPDLLAALMITHTPPGGQGLDHGQMRPPSSSGSRWRGTTEEPSATHNTTRPAWDSTVNATAPPPCRNRIGDQLADHDRRRVQPPLIAVSPAAQHSSDRVAGRRRRVPPAADQAGQSARSSPDPAAETNGTATTVPTPDQRQPTALWSAHAASTAVPLGSGPPRRTAVQRGADSCKVTEPPDPALSGPPRHHAAASPRPYRGSRDSARPHRSRHLPLEIICDNHYRIYVLVGSEFPMDARTSGMEVIMVVLLVPAHYHRRRRSRLGCRRPPSRRH